MTSFLERLIGHKATPAKSAKDRLKFVLVTDRTSISPDDLENMQREIIEVIKKYCDISDEDVELKLEQRERDNYLVADIPLMGGRGEAAIGLAIGVGMEVDDDDIGDFQADTAVHSVDKNEKFDDDDDESEEAEAGGDSEYDEEIDGEADTEIISLDLDEKDS